MEQPISPIAEGFDLLDLAPLAKITNKTFERLAPFGLLQNLSSPDAGPTVDKIVSKIKSYLEAIDSSIAAIQVIYRMSKEAATLFPVDHHEKADQPLLAIAESDRRLRLESLTRLATDAHGKAQKADAVFRQVEQNFYRIAAATKDKSSTVLIPVDPALPKQIRMSLKDVGADLVANLNLLGDFSRHVSDLTKWCAWVKAGLIAGDGTVVPMPGDSLMQIEYICAQWSKIRADALAYHSVVGHTQARYGDLLPSSTALWRVYTGDTKPDNNDEKKLNGNRTPQPGAPRNFTHRMSNLMQDAARHLSCHGLFCA
ncbi:hypothetical protein Hypma_010488 [Hypsizygus marmoreus]|uniref:Uncharacterized protein n=1 Tax=Hypsizygus marmoreus TaxID=39966 RepID=A0A369JPQ9_HYPMA|nr:hypothetical protein Hypma_010488 [Hypsizygus marmoreus]